MQKRHFHRTPNAQGPSEYSKLQAALRKIAASDVEGEGDGKGFSSFDREFGASLAAQVHWTPRQAFAAHKMLRRYVKQLKANGIDFGQIPVPAQVAPKPKLPGGFQRADVGAHRVRLDGTGPPSKRRGHISADGDRFVLIFDYDAVLVNLVKHRLSFPRFDGKAKPPRWTIVATPGTAMAIRVLAEETGFVVDGSALRLMESMGQASRWWRSQSEAIDGPPLNVKVAREPFAYQRAGVQYMLKAKRAIVGDGVGLGKQMNVNVRVMTPDGWRAIGSLRVGDMVTGSDGKPTMVTGVYPQGVKPSYRVRFSDGSSVEAGPEHLWAVEYMRGGRHRHRMVLSTEQLRMRPEIEMGGSTPLDLSKTRLFVPMLSAPVRFNRRGLFGAPSAIPPYTMGQMLANGSMARTTPALTNGTIDWPHMRTMLHAEGATLSVRERTYGNVTHANVVGVASIVRDLGINVKSRYKRIPDEYMRGAVEDRIRLLHGLMDADGSISKTRNRVTYNTTSRGLAGDVRELVEGLGGIASVREYDRSHDDKPTDFQVRIRLPPPIPPFTLPRKLGRYRPGMHAAPKRSVVSVEYVGDAESVCIAVDASDNLYVTEHCILTHNTAEAVMAAESAGAYPCIIVCPASLKLNWRREIGITVPHRSVAVLSGREPSGGVPMVDYLIVNYDILSSWLRVLKAVKPRAIAFDEGHLIKEPKARRSEAAAELASGVEYVWILTATPVKNRPKELLHPLKVLGRLADVGGFWFFAERFCDAHQRYRGKGKMFWDLDGASHVTEMHELLRSTCMLRRTQEDVMAQLPVKRRIVVPVEITNRDEYADEQAEVKAWLKSDRDGDDHLKQLGKISTLRRLTAEGKVKPATEWIRNFLDDTDDEKLIAFAHHRDVQHAIWEAFRENGAARLFADDGRDHQQAEKQRFQEDPECRLIVCSLLSGGFGHTLTAAKTALFVEMGWSSTELEQAEGRSFARMNDPHGLMAYYLIAEGTVEDYMVELVSHKEIIVTASTDGGEAVGKAQVLRRLVKALKEGGGARAGDR